MFLILAGQIVSAVQLINRAYVLACQTLSALHQDAGPNAPLALNVHRTKPALTRNVLTLVLVIADSTQIVELSITVLCALATVAMLVTHLHDVCRNVSTYQFETLKEKTD